MSPGELVDVVDDEKRILSDSYKFISSSYLGWVTGLITGFVTRRFLGPFLMGDWSYLQVILFYGNHANLGVLSAAEKELPFCYGSDDLTRAETIRETSLFFVLITSFLACILILFYGIIVSPGLNFHYFIGLVVIAALVILGQIGLFLTVLYRSEKQFSVLSVEKVLFAIGWLVLSVPFVIFWGIYGIFVAALVQSLISVGYLYSKLRHKIRPRFDALETKKLLGTGVPLLVLSITIITIMSVDKVMIGNLLGSTYLGYYSIAIMASNFVFSLPNAFSIVMFPRIQYRYGKTGEPADLEPFLRKPIITLSFIIPIFCGGVFLLLPVLVNYILPQYVPGLAAMKILLIGTFFISVTHMPNQFLIAINKQTQTATVLVGIIVIAVGLDYLFIRMGMGIEGVALGTTISYLLYYAWILCYALRHYLGWTEVMQFFIRTLLPASITFFVLVFSDVAFASVWPKLGIFAVLATLLLWWTQRQYGFLITIMNAFRFRREEVAL